MAGSTKRAPGPRKQASRPDLKSAAAKAAGGAQDGSAPEQAATGAGLEALLDDNTGNLKAFVQANEAIMTGMAALSTEMAAFATKRLRENIERSETLIGCRDPEQALRVQSDFIESATQQYLDQANSVMNIMAAMTRDFWAPLQEQTEEAVRDLTEQTGSGKQG